MNVREFFRKRRQQKARKRYEQEKARNQAANDPNAMERTADAAKDAGAGFNVNV